MAPLARRAAAVAALAPLLTRELGCCWSVQSRVLPAG
jgi:hypothetical protein